MTKLKHITRPEGQAEYYRFFINETTGQTWKAKVEVRENRKPNVVSDIELSPVELDVVVSVSPVDKDGKAITDKDGKPIVGDSHTNPFTHVQLLDPTFDPAAVVVEMIASRIEVGEAVLAGNEKIRKFAAMWVAKEPISLPVAKLTTDKKGE